MNSVKLIKPAKSVKAVKIVYKGQITQKELDSYEYPKPTLGSIGDVHTIEYSNVRVRDYFYFKVTVIGTQAKTTGLVGAKTIRALELAFRKAVHNVVNIINNLATSMPTCNPRSASIKHNPFSNGVLLKVAFDSGVSYYQFAEYDDAIGFRDMIYRKCLPDAVVSALGSILFASYPNNNFLTRMHFIKVYGWSIPSEYPLHQLNTFLTGKKTLEIGAGQCTYANLLKALGRDIITTDIPESEYHNLDSGVSKAVDHVLDAIDAVAKFDDADTLMMIWPPYITESPKKPDVFFDALKLFKGDYLVYIGESSMGCTGSDEMHEYMYDHFTVVNVTTNTFKGINDSMFLGTRKPKAPTNAPASSNAFTKKSYKDVLISK